jgi:hypothetical protein
VQGSYWLTPRQAFLSRLAGTVFLLAAAAMLVVVAVAGLTPGASPYCSDQGCAWNPVPTKLLDSDVRMQVEASDATRRAFAAHVGRPSVRLQLAAAEAIDSLPFGCLLLCLGRALRRFGMQREEALARGLPWLRRASLAAIVWAISSPFYNSVLESVLSGGTPSGPMVMIALYLDDIAAGLLLAMAAYATIWTLEAGLRTKRDLDDFV